tara:strand:+ start:657 stop:848 length:192 start_codon:yes stop_codon:yes gene_type:complete
MNVQPPTSPPLLPTETKYSQAVKPSTGFRELIKEDLTEIHAGLKNLHFRVLELGESSKGEWKA